MIDIPTDHPKTLRLLRTLCGYLTMVHLFFVALHTWRTVSGTWDAVFVLAVHVASALMGLWVLLKAQRKLEAGQILEAESA